MRLFLLWVCVVPGLALAQGHREGDRVPERDELTARLAGNLVTFHDDSTAFYREDGVYAYRYRPEDPDWVGRYYVGEGGEICVDFANGRDRCDTYVDSDGRLVLITSEGLRFPARSVEPALR